MTDTIHVLLATYNGARFLRRQLDSLAEQSHARWVLLVRDDCSIDETGEILRAYAGADSRIRVLAANAVNRGAVATFSMLMQDALDDGAAYVMLMDQDDIWTPTHIAEQHRLLSLEESRSGSGLPVLVHSDMELIDERERTLHPSFMAFQHIHDETDDPLRTLLVQNYVTGCTVATNRSLLRLALPVPEGAMMHDWWLALVAAATGVIRYNPAATVRYRQHRRNQIGAKGVMRGLSSVWGSLLRSRSDQNDFMRILAQANALERHLEGLRVLSAGNEAHELLRSYCDLFERPCPWYQRIRDLRALGVRRQWFVRQALLYFYAATMSPPSRRGSA